MDQSLTTCEISASYAFQFLIHFWPDIGHQSEEMTNKIFVDDDHFQAKAETYF